MEIFQIVATIAGGIAAIYGAVKAIIALWKWLRTWKIIKLQEFKRLKAIELKHFECELNAPGTIQSEIRAQLARSEPEKIQVNSEFDARAPFKNWK